MITTRMLAGLFLLGMLTFPPHADAAGTLVLPVGAGTAQLVDGDVAGLSFTGGTAVFHAVAGDRVLFAFPLPKGVSFADYGFLEFDVKVEGGPTEVMTFVERPGERRRVWRAVEIHEQPAGWQRMRIDLAMPEIVRESFFKADRPRVAFNIWAFEAGYPDIGRLRTVSIRNVRLLPRLVDVNWDGFTCRRVIDPSGDLMYEYPITVRNPGKTARTVGALVRALDTPFSAAVIPAYPGTDAAKGYLGGARVTPRSAVVAPGDSARFTVTLRLPKKLLGTLAPFTCEWYLPAFTVKGEPGREEYILRSRNIIPLPLIVMPQADRSLAVFGPGGVRALRERYSSADWAKKEGDAVIAQARRILEGAGALPDGPGWAAAYYYCEEHRSPLQYQGPGKHYCPVGKEYRTVDFEGVDLERDHRTSEHDAATRAARTLALAHLLTGEEPFARASLRILEHYRAKYFTWDWMDLDTARDTIDRGRIEFAKYMESYDFRQLMDALEFLRASGGVQRDAAARLERDLFLPALTEIADYRMDLLCRQTTITLTALTGGLLYDNPPLTAFATASPFGYRSLLKWGATADGVCHGHGYGQNHYAVNLLMMADLMDRFGLNVFDPDLKRVADASYRWSSPMNPDAASDILAIAARHWPDPVYRLHARRTLMEEEPPAPLPGMAESGPAPSVDFPHSGLSILRRPDGMGGTLDAVFRWGMTDNRGEFAMLSLDLSMFGRRMQNYPGHFPWGSTDLHHLWQIQTASHTTVVVDTRNHSGMKDYYKGHYQPHPSRGLFFGEGPLATAALAENDRIAPGVRMDRAVCVFDGLYLVIDLLRSESPHTYDWWFHGVPDKAGGAKGVAAEFRPRTEPLGTTDGYQMVGDLSSARISGDLSCEWPMPTGGKPESLTLSALVLNDAPMEAVHGFEWSYQYTKREKEFIVLRREQARNADFVVFLEPRPGASKLTGARRIAVTAPDGTPVADAAGVAFTLAGRRMEVIVNPGGAEVKTASGPSRARVFIAEAPNE